MSSLRPLAVLAAAGIAAVVASAPAGAAPPQPIQAYKHPVVMQELRQRPAELVMSVDGNGYITGLSHWSSWGESYSGARGLDHVNNCQPNCAQGHISKNPGDSHADSSRNLARTFRLRVLHRHARRGVSPTPMSVARWRLGHAPSTRDETIQRR
jgi:hypothetical protein